MRSCGCSDESIVGASTCHGVLGQIQNKLLVGSTLQTEERLDEAQAEKIAYHRTRTTMRRW
jgi:hypothetical protein